MKAYAEYKQSGVKWIGDIPSHWGTLKVGRLMYLGRGRVISNINRNGFVLVLLGSLIANVSAFFEC